MVDWKTESRKRPQGKFHVTIFALIIVLFFGIMFVTNAGAQTTPEPTPICTIIDGKPVCISETNSQTPTATRTPVLGPPPLPTPTATITTQPFPTATPTPHFVYLSLILED